MFTKKKNSTKIGLLFRKNYPFVVLFSKKYLKIFLTKEYSDPENMISHVSPHIPDCGPGPGRHKQALTEPLRP